MTVPGRCRLASRNLGFTFFALLLWVAVIGIALAALGQIWSTASQRERERELLFVGAQFRGAIGRYFEQSPGVKQYPRTLEDLLEDKRFPVVRRHLRKIYLDPITGKADWMVLTRGDQILGVFSPSQDKPLKSANFESANGVFAEASAYSDWRFVYLPSGAPGAGAAALSADTQIARAAEPNFSLGKATPSAPSMSADSQPGLAREPWVCMAARANDLRDCRSAAVQTQQDCERAAAQRYKACLGTAASPFPDR